MWVGHYASGLVAKPFAPGIPLSILCLAGVAPDALFFVLNFLGLESFNLDLGIANGSGGCFPYTNDYPWSHSLAGMGVAGALLAFAYKSLRPHARVSAGDAAVIVLAALSHFLLEWPVHRADVKITPHGDAAYGAGLFDYPLVTFLAEVAIFGAGLLAYTRLSPMVCRTGYLVHPNRLPALVVFIVVQQAHFCFGAAPTTETRWVHAPLFLGEILGTCWLLGKLES
ncbi:hypothetical protein WOLCODRAFT_160587 [Wolfiporia cocos MD-104 SS10]|uniref:Uncharacterized protein n=1 Tax=Wolfiporia cocos (strain MD-104) TaxID=742152 RepID=A0A2H3J5P8_WOLCO|nr:hypothetical protein WOLCODRAFT_160587 [Wolfiporia cocos MD-104 SS10]